MDGFVKIHTIHRGRNARHAGVPGGADIGDVIHEVEYATAVDVAEDVCPLKRHELGDFDLGFVGKLEVRHCRLQNVSRWRRIPTPNTSPMAAMFISRLLPP